jgi:hypothetical protein
MAVFLPKSFKRQNEFSITMTNILLGIGYTLLTVILGKIAFYYIVTFVEYVYYCFNKKELTNEAIKDILSVMSDSKPFIQDVVKVMADKEEMNEEIAGQIIVLPFVQRQIIWKIEEKKYFKRATLEEGLKKSIIRAWNNR